ncbi:MAG TPA: primosomal protein N', partial [Clostridia bacterium]|nr:primosomal protein N' [Clostridia bacterium]
KLLCHYCGGEYPVPALCPECGSRYIKYFGTGTERIEEEVAKLFPQARVTRMDMDTVTAKDSHMHILAEFARGEKNVLVGTQMVTKGLDFPNVLLVGVIAADIGLYMPDYRSAERTFQLITQVGGRAGRNERDGTVIVQTYSPKHYSIALAAKHDYDGFYDYELEMRRRSQFPPFGDYVRAVFSSSDEELAKKCAIDAKGRFGEYIKGFKPIYFGASRAPMGKLKGVYRWQVILRIARDNKSDAMLQDFINVCDKSIVRNVFVSVDVNPANLI